jgi:phage-related protein
VGVADDEVRISTSMDAELEHALARLDQRLSGVETELDKVRAAGKAAGEGVEAGMDKATRATDKMKRAAERAAPPIKEAGDEISKTGTKAAAASSGVDRFADKMQKASRSAGGLGSILSIYKWAGIATGVFALAGGVSALAAGAAIAVGGLAPMVGIVGAIPTLFAAAKLSMLAFTLASSAMESQITRIKNQFTELGDQIAAGGLRSGLNYFANSLERIAAVTGSGLAGLGAELGKAARQAGDIAKSAPFLNQVRTIFAGLRPIVGNVAQGLLYLAQALINVIQASLPMVQDMSQLFLDIAVSVRNWTADMLANGKMAEFMMKAWDLFRRVVGVIVDIMIGLFNILRIGSGYAADMGHSIEDAAYKFRLWTESAQGQARINKYFQDSLPALHEMARFLGIVARAFLGVAGNSNVAPLIAQINDELLPALGRLVASFAGQGGLGPAMIHAAAALTDLFAQMDFSALTLFAQAVATIAKGILWVSQNVPGASFLISSLLTSFLGFKLLGPVFGVVANGAKAFSWLKNAAALTGELTTAQKYFGGIALPMLRTLAGFLLGPLKLAITGIGVAMKAAFVTTPVGWIVLAIVALVAAVIYAWNHFQWFRDAVMAVWNVIKTAAQVVASFFVQVWNGVVGQVVALWNAMVAIFTGVVNTIVAISMWIWDHGLKQVVGIIVVAFQVAWNIIVFIIQTAVYIIVGIITLIAIIVKAVWTVIATVAMWLWNNVLLPVFTAIGVAWNAVTTAIGVAWNAVVTALTTAWNWFWSTILQPVFNAIGVAWNAVTGAIGVAWNAVVGVLTTVWNGFKNVISTVIGAIKSAWNTLVSWMAPIFEPVGRAIGAVFKGIQNVAETVGGVIKGIWDGIVNIVKGVWNFIARGWNAIPSITVPDFVPGIGGKTFGLPKLPILYAGGPTPGGPALVGEHGPELHIRNGQIAGILGARGPEIASLPRGGYVLPNLSTMAAGMAKQIPAPVASAVARSVPAYAAAGGRHDAALARAVRDLSNSVADNRPITVSGSGDVRGEVLDALRTFRREEEARGRYDYTAGRG